MSKNWWQKYLVFDLGVPLRKSGAANDYLNENNKVRVIMSPEEE